MKKDNKKKVKIAIAVLVTALILAVVGVTYAVFNYTGQGSVVNSISTGVMTMTYTEADNKISITNAMPMEDNVGKKLTGTDQVFDFTVETNITGKQSIAYEVTALKADTSTLDDKDVRLYLEKSTDGTTYNEVLAPSAFTPIDSTAPDDTDLYGAKKKEMVLDTGTIQSSVKYYYRLRMWVSKDYKVTKDSKSFTVTVNVYGKDSASLVYTYEKTANASYTNGSAVTKGNWIGTYTCQNGTATLTSCKFSGTVGGTSYNTVCDGGSLGASATYMCTFSSSNVSNLYYNCSTSLPYVGNNSYVGLGGGMPSSESC